MGFHGISWDFMACLRPSYADFAGISWEFESDFHGIFELKPYKWRIKLEKISMNPAGLSMFITDTVEHV